MDLLALLNGLVAQLADAQKAADDLAVLKFTEGAASRQGEVDALVAKVAELQAIIDAGQNPNPDPLQAQLDAAMAQVADLTIQVSASQTRITDLENAVVQKDQEMASFKSAELEKVKALEVDFT